MPLRQISICLLLSLLQSLWGGRCFSKLCVIHWEATQHRAAGGAGAVLAPPPPSTRHPHHSDHGRIPDAAKQSQNETLKTRPAQLQHHFLPFYPRQYCGIAPVPLPALLPALRWFGGEKKVPAPKTRSANMLPKQCKEPSAPPTSHIPSLHTPG